MFSSNLAKGSPPSPTPEGPQLCHFLQNKGVMGEPIPRLGLLQSTAEQQRQGSHNTPFPQSEPFPSHMHLLHPWEFWAQPPRLSEVARITQATAAKLQGCNHDYAAAITLAFATEIQETAFQAPSPHNSIRSIQAAPAAAW